VRTRRHVRERGAANLKAKLVEHEALCHHDDIGGQIAVAEAGDP
jgi:hypothetical protein